MLVIQRPSVEAIEEAEGNQQEFAIGPLEPGFGHTLGNSLRRTLLSSIPGAAITQIKCDDAEHEFSTIEGIVEDVADIVLNLKDVVVVSHSDEPVTLRIEERGPGVVTAATLQDKHADIEILNPDLELATLNKNGRLALEVTIERGRGFLTSKRTLESGVIGIIPVDALFSPVRRVSFVVDPMQVDQAIDHDRLVLEIETDGSLSPREALASAGGTLRALVQLVEEMSDEPVDLNVEKMKKASSHFIGTLDFSSFCKRTPPQDGYRERSLIRTVESATWSEKDNNILEFEIVASSFCHQMVRSIVGVLVRVGKGQISEKKIPVILEAQDRQGVGSPAPPHGLILWSVRYPSVAEDLNRVAEGESAP